jgi:chromatin remodeling complex protein RSC6
MSKRSAVSLNKLKCLVEGNPAISVQLQGKILKIVDSAMKKAKPSKEDTETKVPGTSQFDKKMLVSDEMCDFACWPRNSLHSRVEVTDAIWNRYVKANDMRSSTNKRIGKLDNKLKALLKVDVDELTYPQIQKYIGQHLTRVVV